MLPSTTHEQVAPAKNRRPAAVYGAYGHTGRFVVAELERRGWAVIACGRDPQKLRAHFADRPGLEIRAASLEAPDSLERAFHGAFAVVHCAGPFLDSAEPVMHAALRNRIHYLDMSAEQRATLAAFEQFSEAARTQQVTILPSMGFFGCLADLLASAAMKDWDSATEIRVVTGLSSWHPTRGTRLTGQRNNYRRSIVTGGRLESIADPPPRDLWDFSLPFGTQEVVEFPLAETIVISRHLKVLSLRSFINAASLDNLHDPNTPEPVVVDEQGRSAQEFVMDVTVSRGSECRRARARGRDIYAISAPLVAEALNRLVTISNSSAGTRTAGEIFDAEDFLHSLAGSGLSVDLPWVENKSANA